MEIRSTRTSCIDITERGAHPVRDNNPGYALFFIAVIVVCSIVITNLFVGIVVDSFNIVKSQESGLVNLTEGQIRWINTMKLMMRTRPALDVAPLKGYGRKSMEHPLC